MAHLHASYTFLTAEIDGASIGVINTNAAKILDTQLQGITQPFLMKRLQMLGQCSGVVDAECFIIGLAHGQATIVEIGDAFNASQIDPDDPTNAAVMAKAGIMVYWQSLSVVNSDSNGDGSTIINLNVRMGGGRGIPLHEEKGCQVFAYNPMSTNSTGTAKLDCVMIIGGVWMRG